MNTTITDTLKNITNPEDIIYNINDASGNLLGITFIFTIYIILFISVYSASGNLKTSYNAATYIALILCWLAWVLNLVESSWLYLFLVLGIIGIISIFIREEG